MTAVGEKAAGCKKLSIDQAVGEENQVVDKMRGREEGKVKWQEREGNGRRREGKGEKKGKGRREGK